MPDQPLFDLPFDNTINNLIGGLILLKATDDLDFAMLLICGKDGKVL